MHDMIFAILGIGIIVWLGYELLYGGGRDQGTNGDGGPGGLG
jgi:hypothetical protein